MGDLQGTSKQSASVKGNRLICGDVLDVLPTLGRFKLMICDPPDNIGLGYDGYDDDQPTDMYLDIFERWLWHFVHHADIVWVSFNARWLLEIGDIMTRSFRCKTFNECEARIFIQPFTFGQNRDSDCGNGYRPLLRIMHRDAALYPKAIRVPSWRQLNGDKRAAVGGRVPLDVWDFPRVTGNSSQRRVWHPTQLNEGLIDRIVNFSTLPGDSICDCFSGTGTVLRAVKDRPVTSIELSPEYCRRIAMEHKLNIEMFGRAIAV